MRHTARVMVRTVALAPLLTVAQAAAELGMTEWAVRTAIWDGVLPAVRIGRAVRVKLEDLKAWSERCAGGESAP